MDFVDLYFVMVLGIGVSLAALATIFVPIIAVMALSSWWIDHITKSPDV